MIPCELRPAATNRVRTSGASPRGAFPSGGDLSEVEVRVGREALRSAEVVAEAGVVQHRESLTRGLQHRREVVPVLAELHESARRNTPRPLRPPPPRPPARHAA